MGLLKILLGKPGTLHSPGHILSFGPGRPAGPKRRFSHFEDWSRTAAGWGCGCVPTDPAGRVCLSYQARVGPSHNTHVGPALNPLALPLFTYYFLKSRTLIILPILAVAYRSGGEALAGSYGACTPPRRQLLRGVAGSPSLYRTGFYIKPT